MSAGDWKEFYAAACAGDEDTVRWALARGVDPNFQHAEYGTTALIGAVENGRLGIVRLLLANGADPRLVARWDQVDALAAARSANRREILDELMKAADES